MLSRRSLLGFGGFAIRRIPEDFSEALSRRRFGGFAIRRIAFAYFLTLNL